MAGPSVTLMDCETQDTRDLVELARAGDAEAYGQVYRLHAPRLLRHAMLLCGDPALAEELAQDTLVEAWTCLRRYQGRCEFFTWLCAILLHRHHNYRRRPLPVPFSRVGGGDQHEFRAPMERLADTAPGPDESTATREQQALVRRCLELLPAKHRQVVFLRFYVEESLEEIADALGCSVGTVKSRLFHALERLRRMRALDPEREFGPRRVN